MKCPRCAHDNTGVPVSEGIFICCQCRARINMDPEVLEILGTEASDYDKGHTVGYESGYQAGLAISADIQRNYQKAWDAGYEAALEEIKRQREAAEITQETVDETIDEAFERGRQACREALPSPDPITGKADTEYSKDPVGDSPYPVVEI